MPGQMSIHNTAGIPLTKTVQNREGAQPISEILHIEKSKFVVLRHISYLFNVRANVVNPNKTGMLKDFVCEMCFLHKLVIHKYHQSCLNELTFKGNIFSFIKLFTIVFCSFHVTFNGNI